MLVIFKWSFLGKSIKGVSKNTIEWGRVLGNERWCSVFREKEIKELGLEFKLVNCNKTAYEFVDTLAKTIADRKAMSYGALVPS